MEVSNGIDNLVAARDILKSSIQKSRNIGISVVESGLRLTAARHNLASLQPDIKDMASKFAVHEIRDHVDRAIGPASSVLKALDLVYELQDSLSTHPPPLNLFIYLADIKRLLQALKLLSETCRLVITWLEDVVRILKNNAADHHLARVLKVVQLLVELQSFSNPGDGGVLYCAFNNLESEYKRRIETSCSSIQELQGIAEVMAANNRLAKCVHVHAESRIAKARATLQSLNLDYLDIRLSEIDSVQSVEVYINEWDKQMEFAVRNVLLKEYRLCSEVFQEFGSHVWMHCFAKIATECGFLDIFDFGTSVCKCKKEAIKLLSLLKVFSTLDRLRLEFNEMFDGEFCVKIQNRTRGLVKKVVDGACEIFCQLSAQVELQRASSPPSDGNVPRLVYFVTEYCNQLLEDENRSILSGALEIYQVWNQVKFEDGLLSNEIHSIMKAVEINLETWAQSYYDDDDTALSYLFMMNNHWYLCNSTRGTKLGDLMGNSWLWAYAESTEYYQGLYMRESWEKLLVYLREEGLILFPGGRAIDRNLVKKRIAGFCEAFDEMCKKQSKWTLYDKALKWKTCQLIIEAVVLPYNSYLQRFMPESDMGNQYHVKYTGEKLEKLIGSLFQLKIAKYDSSSKFTDMIDIKNAAAA
ncbi:hypothetical protein ACS0TY_024388 [Phlomoides rotata]